MRWKKREELLYNHRFFGALPTFSVSILDTNEDTPVALSIAFLAASSFPSIHVKAWLGPPEKRDTERQEIEERSNSYWEGRDGGGEGQRELASGYLCGYLCESPNKEKKEGTSLNVVVKEKKKKKIQSQNPGHE